MESNTGLHTNGRLISLPVNVRIGWNLMEVANTLTYYKKATTTAVTSFIIQAPRVFVHCFVFLGSSLGAYLSGTTEGKLQGA